MLQTPVTLISPSATTCPQLKELGGLAFRFLISALVLAGLSGCGPTYSPDTYASNAAQQANKVEQGVVVGVRPVAVSAAGTVGTVTGAAAGGIAGSQVGTGPVSAFTSLGGALVGGLGGSAVEHVTADTTAFEYIVRKPNGDLVSVTQKDKTPLVLGQKVLVIAGVQARVVPDYTVPPLAPTPKGAEAAKTDTASPKPADAQPTQAAQPPGDASPTAPAATDGKPAAAVSSDTKSAATPAGTNSSGANPAAVQSGDAKPPAVPQSDPKSPAQVGDTKPAAGQSGGGRPEAGSGDRSPPSANPANGATTP
jgi:outer membrane lipoprotein SlyB